MTETKDAGSKKELMKALKETSRQDQAGNDKRLNQSRR
jgi:ribosomal protein L39E